MSEITFPNSGSHGLESYVARLLDEAGVPNFIWGEPVLSILGSETVTFFSGWTIPDEHIETAARVLDEAKFPPCTQGREHCLVFKMPIQPYPDYHWHTDLYYPTEGIYWTHGVFLYRKSRLFWAFPDPPIGAPAPGDPYYMLTSDRRIIRIHPTARGRQSGHPSLYPVKMLTPARYTEAIYLNILRNLAGQRALGYWEIEANYVFGDSPLPNGPSNVNIDELVEPFREWAKRDTNKEYAKAVGDPLPSKIRFPIFLDMKRNYQLPPPDEKEIVKGTIPLKDRLRAAVDGPIDYPE